MKRKISAFMALLMLFGTVCTGGVYADERLAAFPGAEGGGMYSLGARAAKNIEVVHVTNLNDTGEGSFRDAVSRGNRIVVFDVAGTVKLKNILKISDIDNITILGQTAPGEGICIAGESVLFTQCDNVILRYLRIRPGDTCYSQEDGLGVRKCTDFIVDHCSVSWSVDECLSAYENKDFTAQYCIISESLNDSLHKKGSHGYGGIWGGINASFHHNLISSHKSRLPRIGTSATVHSYNDTPDYESLVDIRNNVFYNWLSESGYGGERNVRVNIVNNYYIPTSMSKHVRFFDSWGTTLHVSGNIMENYPYITEDNWLGADNVSNGTKCESISDGYTDVNGRLWQNDQYIYDFPVNTQTAENARDTVLEEVGANHYRDETDRRIIDDVINKTVPTGSRSGKGVIDSPEDVGGYAPLHGRKEIDSDQDGIPDKWEQAKGLDINAFDSTDIAPNGYTNLENYANDIIKDRYAGYDVDFTNLREQIKNAENADRDLFSEKDWEELENVLEYAKQVYDLTAPSQERADGAAAALKKALSSIVISDEEYLKAALEKAELTDKMLYTKESLDILYNAASEGKTVLENKEKKKYKQCADKIYSAIHSLKYGIKKALKDETDQIKAMDTDHLTDEAQARINAVLTDAERVYNDDSAEDEEINAVMQSVIGLVTQGRYERKNKGEVIALQDFELNENTDIFHTSSDEYWLEPRMGAGSNKSFVLFTKTNSNALPYICDFPQIPEHFMVSVDMRIEKIYEMGHFMSLEKNKKPSDEFTAAFEHYISAFDDWSSLSVEVNRAKGSVVYYINDMPIYREQIGSRRFNAAYLSAANIDDAVYFDNFTFTALENERFLIGDANADGVLTANDPAAVLQKVLLSSYTMPIEEKTRDYMFYMDTNADGILTAGDSAAILQKVLLSTYKMPAELTTTTETTTETTTLTTETTTETTTENTTYYIYQTPNGALYADIENGMLIGCAEDYTGGTLPEEIDGTRMSAIGECAFEGSAVEEIVIPESYGKVKGYAFRNCKKLKRVVFENNPDMIIYAMAFKGCTALEDVTLPLSLRGLERGIFENCPSLKKLVIPENVQKLNEHIVDMSCVLYITEKVEFYAQQYGYQYVLY